MVMTSIFFFGVLVILCLLHGRPSSITLNDNRTCFEQTFCCEIASDVDQEPIDHERLWPAVCVAERAFPNVYFADTVVRRVGARPGVKKYVKIERLLVQAISTTNRYVKHFCVGKWLEKSQCKV